MHVKAQVVFQGGSLLPEDRYVNTLHFDSAEVALDLAAAIIHGPLSEFYTAPGTGRANTVGSLLSPYVQRAFTVRYYDMADPEPRVPIVATATLAAAPSGAEGLPEEVSIVHAFHGAPPVTARRRGRNYLGPLNVSAFDGGTTSTPARVDSGARSDIAASAADLAAAEVGWCVYSGVSGLLVPVVAGWIDNELDTQRRRGAESSSRTVWALP